MQVCQPDIGLSGLTAGKTSLRGEKNLPMMTLSLREQTLTNITQGIRNHLMWEKEPAHPPARYRDLATRSKQQRNLPAYPKA